MEELGDAGGDGFDVLRHVERGEFGAGAGLVFEGLPVEDEADVSALLVAAFFFVKALFGLVAEPLVFEHLRDEGCEAYFGALVFDPLGLSREVGGYVGEDVDADHVAEAEGAGAGPAESGAGEGVNLFDSEALGHHEADGVAHGEGADAVGDEVGCVVGVDDRFAEALVAEVRDHRDVCGVGLQGGDDFEEAHVARRIEEVSSEEVGFDVGAEAIGNADDGEAAGVGGEDRAGAKVLLNLGEECVLYVEVLGYGFDDPVAVGEEGEVVVEVSDGDEAGAVRGIESGGLGLLEAVEGAEEELVSFGLCSLGRDARRNDVEEDYWQPGIGDMGGDAGAHGSGSKNGGFTDLSGGTGGHLADSDGQ